MSYNPNKTTWMNPSIEYLFDSNIIEYDMREAGFSLIKQFRLLHPDRIKELDAVDKSKRHIAIGVIMRDDKEFSKRLTDKFAEARGMFIDANSLTDNRIISVKKDAIFTIDNCNKTKFSSIEFVEKNRYSSYMRLVELRNIELYYNDGVLDIKGISDISANKHRLYILSFIIKMIDLIENKDSRAKRYLMNFISDYKAGRLDEEYYVKFDNLSSEFDALYNYKGIVVPFVQLVMKEFSI